MSHVCDIRKASSLDQEGMQAVVADRPTISANLPKWVSRSYVLVKNGGIIGFVSRGVTNFEIHALYVRADDRGQGAGTKLLSYAEAIIRNEGEYCARLYVEADNVDARDFYIRHGYIDTHMGSNGWILEKHFGEVPQLEHRHL